MVIPSAQHAATPCPGATLVEICHQDLTGDCLVKRGITYCCGNKSIANQLQHWVNRKREEKARLQGATMPDQVNFIASVGRVDLLLNVNIARKVVNFWKNLLV